MREHENTMTGFDLKNRMAQSSSFWIVWHRGHSDDERIPAWRAPLHLHGRGRFNSRASDLTGLTSKARAPCKNLLLCKPAKCIAEKQLGIALVEKQLRIALTNTHSCTHSHIRCWKLVTRTRSWCPICHQSHPSGRSLGCTE